MKAPLRIMLSIVVASTISLPTMCAQSPEHQPGRIAGYLVPGHHRRSGAVVFLCDAKTGIPLNSSTWRPFVAGGPEQNSDQRLKLIETRTKEKGFFEFRDVPAGDYRLVAQSWAGEYRGPFEVNSAVIELHGVANVQVPSPEAERVSIRRMGTGVLHIDQKFPNSSGILMISLAPPVGDSILGFTGLGDKFFQSMIGGNRMPYGETTIVGLPAGKVYTAVFAPDNVPGFGFGAYDVRPAITVKMPVVAGWTDGVHDAPPRIDRICRWWKEKAGMERVTRAELWKLLGLPEKAIAELENAGGVRGDYGKYRRWLSAIGPLDRTLELEGLGKVTAADVMAAYGYLELQFMLKQRKKK